MELYLLRHGIADDLTPGQSDADRALTAEGKKKLREILKVAAKAELRPSLILSSPYRRARETALLAAKHLQYEGDVLETQSILPHATPQEVWEEVRMHKDERALLLVAHEPLLSSSAAYLLGSPSLVTDFKKGSILRIDVESFGAQPRGVLRWYLTPRLAHS